jgi:hypothetical protein
MAKFKVGLCLFDGTTAGRNLHIPAVYVSRALDFEPDNELSRYRGAPTPSVTAVFVSVRFAAYEWMKLYGNIRHRLDVELDGSWTLIDQETDRVIDFYDPGGECEQRYMQDAAEVEMGNSPWASSSYEDYARA